MISLETATKIALAYREIETATNLLAKVKEAVDKHEPKDLRDVFGRRQTSLQLGVPSGETGRRMFDVPYTLAVPVIEAHIAHHRAQLVALNESARSEIAAGSLLDGVQRDGMPS